MRAGVTGGGERIEARAHRGARATRAPGYMKSLLTKRRPRYLTADGVDPFSALRSPVAAPGRPALAHAHFGPLNSNK